MTTTTTPNLSTPSSCEVPDTTEALCVNVTQALSVSTLRTLFAGVLRDYLDNCDLNPQSDAVAALRVQGVASDVAWVAAGVAEAALSLEAGSQPQDCEVVHLATEALCGGIASHSRGDGTRTLGPTSVGWARRLRAELGLTGGGAA